jgi:hypothetical protein
MTIEKIEDEYDFEMACSLGEAIEDFIFKDANDTTLALACMMAASTYIHRSGMRVGIAASILHGFVRNVREFEETETSDSDQH